MLIKATQLPLPFPPEIWSEVSTKGEKYRIDEWDGLISVSGELRNELEKVGFFSRKEEDATKENIH